MTEIKFQFHYGTIKRLADSVPLVKVPYFNSTMVRLKVYQLLKRIGTDYISIPLWYD